MAQSTIVHIRDLVRSLNYVVSLHAAEEPEDENLTMSSSPSILSSRLCASCGRPGVRVREVTRSFGSGETLLVIEGIPMWSCPHCGESYFTAQTMHEIERIKALRRSVAVDRELPVAAFPTYSA